MEQEILEFGMAPWFRMLERLLDQLWPVRDGCSQVAAMNKIKGCTEGPWLFRIVNFKFNVAWNPAHSIVN